MDSFWLFLSIIGPIAVPSFLLALLGTGDSLADKFKSLLKLNSQNSLLRQRLFWLSISIPVCYFFAFGFIIWKDYSPDFSGTGLNTFVSISKFPLALLSAAVPLAVTIASFHSTQQTAELISIATRKSNLESYYLHRSEFFLYFERYEKTRYLDCFNAEYNISPRLYDNCFKGRPENGTPEIDKEFFINIETSLLTFEKHLDEAIKGKKDKENLVYNYLLTACPRLFYVSIALGLYEIYETLADKNPLIPIHLESYPPNEARLHGTLGTTTKQAVAAYRYVCDYYEILCKYAGRETHNHSDKYNYLAWGRSPALEKGNIEWFFLEVTGNLHAIARIHKYKIVNTQFNEVLE